MKKHVAGIWKRLAKWVSLLLAGVVGIVVVAACLLYVPGVQNFVKNKVEKSVSESTGMDIVVGRVLLRFPLNVDVEDVFVGDGRQDTLVAAETIRVNVGLGRILKGVVSVKELGVRQATVRYRDTVSGMLLDARVGELRLQVREVDLKRRVADVSLLALERGRVRFEPGKASEEVDTTGGGALLDWQLRVEEIALSQVDYEMGGAMRAGVGNAAIRDGGIDLGRQTVAIGGVSLEEGYCELLTGEEEPADNVVADTAETLPWTVSVGRVALADSRFYMRPLGVSPDMAAFPDVIDVRGLSLEIDSVYNRGTEVDARIRHIALREAGGLEVKDLEGNVTLGEKEMKVDGLSVRTLNSQLSVDVAVGAGLADFGEDSPLRVDLWGKVGGGDLAPFVQGVDEEVGKLLRESSFALTARTEGSLNQLDLPELRLKVDSTLVLAMRGNVSSLTKGENMEGQVEMNLRVDDGRVADVFTGGGITVPDSLRLNVLAALKEQEADVRLNLSQGDGAIAGDAHYGLESRRYRLTLDMRDFDAEAFLPGDSIGRVTASVRARGQGWDWTRDSGRVELDLKSLDYKGYHYKDVVLWAGMAGGELKGELSSGNEALDLDLAFEGKVTDEFYRGALGGDIRRVDLRALRFSADELAFALGMNIEGEWRMSGEAGLRTSLTDMNLNNGQEYQLGDLSLQAEASGRQTKLGVDAGDLKVRFTGEENVGVLVEKLSEVGKIVAEQLNAYAFDAEKVQQALPAFQFEISAGKDNLVSRYLRGNSVGFRDLALSTGYAPGDDWKLEARTDSVAVGGFVIDSVRAGAFRDKRSLRYGVDVCASPEQLEGVAELGVHGNVVDNQVNVRLREKGDGREEVFNVGANVAFEPEAVSVSISPLPLVLGYMSWQVNRGNYIRVSKEGMVAADLKLLNEDKRVRLVSRGKDRDRPEALDVDIKGIDLGRISEAMSFLPEMAGMLAVDVHVATAGEGLDLAGQVRIDELAYLKKRVGDIKLGMRYKQGEENGRQVDAGLSVDGSDAVRVKGALADGGSEGMDVKVSIPQFPLRLANVFTPEGTVGLEGFLRGQVAITGAMDAPLLNGELAFQDGKAEAAMIGTTFSIDSVPLVIKDNVLDFNRWGIIAPNKRRLEFGGNVDFTSFADIKMNASLKAKNFQVIGVEENDKTIVYGRAYMDLSTTIKGPLNALQVRGDVGILANTDINYALKSSPLEVSDKSEEVVRFVSFQDTLKVNKADTLEQLKTTSLDLLLSVKIDLTVGMNVLLSSSNQDRVSIQGGGELTYSLNPLGDSRLVGRYVLSGGLISYGLPVIGTKEFKIQDGNYVEWKGNLMNPDINVTAAETISASVTDDSQNSRLVNFQAMIKVGGSLEKLDVAFDLSATGDITIQNQLAGMTPEERAKEAMNLMLYGTYTAPGTVAKNNVSDNAINNLVEKELNEWSRKHLKGVDLSFGINSYNQVTEGGESKKTDYSYQFSKRLFNNKVRVSVGGRISTDNNPAESGGMEENLVDDISLEYMFGNSSKYFLKLFRHTGYESVLEGEVTQTGISVVLRKKFQEFLDMFRRKKNRQVEKVEQNGLSEK